MTDDTTVSITTPDGHTTPAVTLDQFHELADHLGPRLRHSFTIDAAAILRPIHAVLPHTKGTEGDDRLHRIRVTVGRDYVEVSAAAPGTCIVTRVAGWALDVADYDARFTFDLHPADLAIVAKLFKPPKDTTITLRFDIARDDMVSVTDASGLPGVDVGRSYVMPIVAKADHYPDVHKLILDTMNARRGLVGCVTYTGSSLGRWADTAQVYRLNAVVEPTREERPFIVTVGDSCIGLLNPVANDDSPDEGAGAVRVKWTERLSGLWAYESAAHPAEDGNDEDDGGDPDDEE